jgi:hypothetical protein
MEPSKKMDDTRKRLIDFYEKNKNKNKTNKIRVSKKTQDSINDWNKELKYVKNNNLQHIAEGNENDNSKEKECTLDNCSISGGRKNKKRRTYKKRNKKYRKSRKIRKSVYKR